MKIPIRHIEKLNLTKWFSDKWVHFGNGYEIHITSEDRAPIEEVWSVKCVVFDEDGEDRVIFKETHLTFDGAVRVAQGHVVYSPEYGRKMMEMPF